MTIIQIVVFRLRRTYNNVELACNKHHVEALSKLEETEGFYKGVWSVTKEDASILVWLIGKCLSTTGYYILYRTVCNQG